MCACLYASSTCFLNLGIWWRIVCCVLCSGVFCSGELLKVRVVNVRLCSFSLKLILPDLAANHQAAHEAKVVDMDDRSDGGLFEELSGSESGADHCAMHLIQSP